MTRAVSFILFVSILLIVGCQSATDSSNDDQKDQTMKREAIEVKADSARIITLPTPMQIPALLRNTKAQYNRDMLLPIVRSEKAFFKSNLLFGIYMLDLAYASSFSDRQASREYFKKCKSLSDDMGIGAQIEEQLVQRFERNLEHPDSLGRIILEMYDMGHLYFQQHEREGVGLIMIMGCYFEGMHFTFEQAKDHDLFLFVHLLNQQLQYADNLIYALEEYEIPEEVTTEYNTLIEVYRTLKEIDPPSVYDLRTGSATISDIEKDKLEHLQRLVAEFRQSVVI